MPHREGPRGGVHKDWSDFAWPIGAGDVNTRRDRENHKARVSAKQRVIGKLRKNSPVVGSKTTSFQVASNMILALESAKGVFEVMAKRGRFLDQTISEIDRAIAQGQAKFQERKPRPGLPRSWNGTFAPRKKR